MIFCITEFAIKNIRSFFKWTSSTSWFIFVTTFFLLIVNGLLIPNFTLGEVYIGKWISVPIRTVNQKEAGLAGGEGFQYVLDIIYAPSNPSIAYFCVDTSKIWKSKDGGFTWQHKSRGFLAHGARSIIVDPKNSDIVFAAAFLGYNVKKGSKYLGATRGIYKTIDGGEEWSLMQETDFFKQESKGRLFAFDSSSGDVLHTSVIFAGSYREGLLKSINGGVTWNCIGFEGKHIIDIEEDPLAPGILFIATEEGLFRYSANSIESLGTGLPSWPRSIAVHHQNSKIIYAAMGTHGVFKSIDGGKKFKPSQHGLPSNVFCADIACSTVDSNIVYISFQESGRLNPYYSHDAGKTWKRPETIDEGKLSHTGGQWFSSTIAPHPSDALVALFAANGRARILKTADGGKRWAYSSTGFTGGRMMDIAFAKDGKMVFFLTDHGIWLTEDRGATFRELKVARILGLKSSCSGDIRGNTMIASLGSWGAKGLLVSHDTGNTWKIFDKLIDRFHFIAIHPSQDNIIYAGPYYSSDNGNNWQKLPQTVRAMYDSNGDIVYSVACEGRRKCSILKSVDQGKSWVKPYPICPVSAKAINDIDIAPDNPDKIYLATSNGLWIFEGKNWIVRNADHGLDKDFFNMCYLSSVGVDPNNANIIYAGRKAPGRGKSNGVFRSIDLGLTWKNITYNLGHHLTVWSVKINPLDSAVYIGTSLGTFRLVSDPTSVQQF